MTKTTTAIIEPDRLQKNLDRFTALKDISLALAPGQVLGFLGPNRTGKSTTIRVISGLLKKSGGSVTVFGKNAWWDDAAIHPRTAYVPGDVRLWPNLSGGEIIDLLLCLNSRQHNQKTDELIKAFESDPEKGACTYSKGNHQKVVLVAALSQDVDLYILGESTSRLDPLNEQTSQQEVLKLKRAGRSVLLSSHILSEVGRICDPIAIVHDGSVIGSGNLDRLWHLSQVEIEVTTATPMTALTEQAGVHGLAYYDSEYTKAVFTAGRNAFGTIMTTLAADTVVDIQSTSPTLKDLSLRYYGKQDEIHAIQ